MLRSFKTEIDPTSDQMNMINRTIGTCRYMYNFFISQNKEWFEHGKPFLRGHAFNVWLNNVYLPNNPEFMWIKEVNTSAVKRSIDDADSAYQKFFKGKGGYPQFKKKNQSDVKMYFYKKNKTDCVCERHRLKVPSLGWVRLKEKGYIPTTDTGCYIKSGRISKRAGRYYVSVVVEMPDKPQISDMTDGIGLHLGVRELAVTSGGMRFDNVNKTERVRKLEKGLKRAQRSLSRKFENEKYGGETQRKNIKKQKMKVQKMYQRICNVRDDYINKTISEIVKTKPSYITIADMDLTYIMKNRYVVKLVKDQKLRYFRERLTAKCHELGIELRIAEKTYQSASICSACGKLRKGSSFATGVFRCACGYSEDRSLNASYNLRDTKIYKIA